MIWKNSCHPLRIFRNGLNKSGFKIGNKDARISLILYHGSILFNANFRRKINMNLLFKFLLTANATSWMLVVYGIKEKTRYKGDYNYYLQQAELKKKQQYWEFHSVFLE